MEKMRLLKEQSPSEFAKMRVLFTKHNLRVPNRKKELASVWAEKLGLIYACGSEIPEEWLDV